GLRNSPCITAPAMARAAPTRAPNNTRGRRKSHTTVTTAGSAAASRRSPVQSCSKDKGIGPMTRPKVDAAISNNANRTPAPAGELRLQARHTLAVGTLNCQRRKFRKTSCNVLVMGADLVSRGIRHQLQNLSHRLGQTRTKTQQIHAVELENTTL